MRPGITCLWQVEGRNKIMDFNEWANLDLKYIDNWSLFNDFERALKEWSDVRENHDSLVAVKPFKGHLLDETANPVNYAFGYWHKVSQKLPPLYSVLWSLFILKRETVQKFQYHIGVNPHLFVTDTMVIDIDYEEDFELAQMVYKKLQG